MKHRLSSARPGRFPGSMDRSLGQSIYRPKLVFRPTCDVREHRNVLDFFFLKISPEDVGKRDADI